LVWRESGLEFGKWDGGTNGDSIYEKRIQIPASESVQNNGSIYLHTFVVKQGKSPDPK
jgi:hypothetical protein